MICSSLWLLLMLHDTPSSNALALKELGTRAAVECESQEPYAQPRQPSAVLPGARPRDRTRPANARSPA